MMFKELTKKETVPHNNNSAKKRKTLKQDTETLFWGGGGVTFLNIVNKTQLKKFILCF